MQHFLREGCEGVLNRQKAAGALQQATSRVSSIFRKFEEEGEGEALSRLVGPAAATLCKSDPDEKPSGRCPVSADAAASAIWLFRRLYLDQKMDTPVTFDSDKTNLSRVYLLIGRNQL